MKRLKKKIYLRCCGMLLAILALIRLVFPGVMSGAIKMTKADTDSIPATLVAEQQPDINQVVTTQSPSRKYHPLGHTADYDVCFPDVQDTQIVAAKRWGITPMLNSDELAKHKSELVYIGASPFYVLDKGMTSSLPYLVPRASALVDRIGRGFMDSLYVRGIPLHKVIVTSALRTKSNVAELQKVNVNATEGSCHGYGTTVDICYSRYYTVAPPGETRRVVSDDTLKYVLSQVLRDLREEGACYVKHEKKQGCFHLTVR